MNEPRLLWSGALLWFSILAAVACFLVFSCSDSDDEPATDRTMEENDDDSVDSTPDYEACTQSLERVYYDCGGEFIDAEGDPVGINAMLSLCGQELLDCIIKCDASTADCEAIKTCLGDECGLTVQ